MSIAHLQRITANYRKIFWADEPKIDICIVYDYVLF